jgi:DegV family protein with EDD domain
MPKIAVVTDSTASVPESILNSLHIATVAYYMHRCQEILRDLVTIQRDEFLRWLGTANFVPTTANPGPGDYFDVYEKLAREGADGIISIHMSSKISGAYQAASVARSMLQQSQPAVQVEVIDSRNAALSQGWMAIQAARAALAGISLAEIAASVKKMIPMSHMIQTADTLRYLYLGGRIGRAQNLLGSMLNIKPLIGLEGGEIVPLGRAHSRGQAYARMVEMITGIIGQGKARVAYVHAGALREAEKLKSLVEARVDVVESLFAELSPVLAVHTGPGMAGLCYTVEE